MTIAILAVPIATLAWQFRVQEGERAVVAALERDQVFMVAHWERSDAWYWFPRRLRRVKFTSIPREPSHSYIPGLKRLAVRHVAILSRLPALRELDISHCGDIEPAALRALPSLRTVETLDLSFTKVGNDAIEHLAGMRGLKELHIQQAEIDDDGLAELRRLRPDIAVWDD